MSMLAEPRRKQKVINLRAKNNAWSSDTNKFGQRMLEKMGWTSGKGLGANENGIVEHVVARYKNDDRGLGFQDKNDQWTKHEDDFNALLANLSNSDSKEEKLHSGISLEDKSKKSKARVHYHKFTRGKDLTQYSEKDLANIFGKKSLKNKEKLEVVKDDIKATEQVFTEKGSMTDYFKNKLAALKSSGKPSVVTLVDQDNYEADYSFQGFAGASNGDTDSDVQKFTCQGLSCYNTEGNDFQELAEVNIESQKMKKIKKSKKKEKNIEESNVCAQTQELEIDNVLEVNIVKKKSKKNKQEDETQELDKKPKNQRSKSPKDQNMKEILDTNIYVPKKKKKRKNKDNNL